ncbi:MAG: alpha/beta fold hydrolase [Promethearchaeota archaeon]
MVSLRMFYSRTPKIKDINGKIKENSVASLEKVKIGKIDQWIIIRGHDKGNPILLFLHGGPGSIEGPFAYKFQRDLEEHFIIVNWDQRGAGKSYSRKIPKDSMTIEQFILDAHELIQLLLNRFNQEKLYLVGHSWGSILGTLVVSRYPELIQAYVGIGQVVNILDNEKVSYRYTIEQAKERGNEKALKQLKKLEPYPEKDINDTKALRKQRKWLLKFNGVMHNESGWWPHLKIALGSPEYSLKDMIKSIGGLKLSLKTLWSQLFEIDFPKQIPELKVPVYICMGRFDYNTPFELARKYFNQLQAPKKEFIWFENSAHMLNTEESEKFNDFLINTVLKETRKG